MKNHAASGYGGWLGQKSAHQRCLQLYSSDVEVIAGNAEVRLSKVKGGEVMKVKTNVNAGRGSYFKDRQSWGIRSFG